MINVKKLLILSIGLFCSYYLQSQSREPGEIVSEYIDDQISVDLNQYYSIWTNCHPDFSFPPGETEYIHVIDTNYSIINVRQEILNKNYMEPKDELITIVTARFQLYFSIVDNKYTVSEHNQYLRDYFLSNSTGELLILGVTDPLWKLSTMDSVYNWTIEHIEQSSEMRDLLIKIKERK